MRREKENVCYNHHVIDMNTWIIILLTVYVTLNSILHNITIIDYFLTLTRF